MNKNSIISAVKAHQPSLMTDTSIAAAVMVILIYDDQDNLSLIITKRSDNIATYAGQYCFPGGVRESFEFDFKQTVIREVYEELTLEEKYYQMVGQLDDFNDRFGNIVRPFVAIMSRQDFENHHQKSLKEVTDIFYFPLEDLVKLERDENLERVNKRHPTYRYENGTVIIWGLTASIIVHFGNIIYGLERPVGEGSK